MLTEGFFFFKLSSFPSFLYEIWLSSKLFWMCINQPKIQFAAVTNNPHTARTYSNKDFTLIYATCSTQPPGQLQLYPMLSSLWDTAPIWDISSPWQREKRTWQTRHWPLKLELWHNTSYFYAHALVRANHMVKPDISGMEEPHRNGARILGWPVRYSTTLWFQLRELVREGRWGISGPNAK